MTQQKKEKLDQAREKNMVPIGDPFRARVENLISQLQSTLVGTNVFTQVAAPVGVQMDTP